MDISEALYVFVLLENTACLSMMTSSNGNTFCVTGYLCGEFTGPRWIPHTKASDVELWCFLMICVWINGWVNNRKAGDLRHYRVHFDVTVMSCGVWCPHALFHSRDPTNLQDFQAGSVSFLTEYFSVLVFYVHWSLNFVFIEFCWGRWFYCVDSWFIYRCPARIVNILLINDKCVLIFSDGCLLWLRIRMITIIYRFWISVIGSDVQGNISCIFKFILDKFNCVMQVIYKQD